MRIPIRPDRSAGEPALVVADPSELFGIDGITVDALGAIYGAVNIANRIVRIERDSGTVATVATGAPLDFPSAVTFGTGRAKHTLFVVNFSLIHFLSNPPMPGNANVRMLRHGV